MTRLIVTQHARGMTPAATREALIEALGTMTMNRLARECGISIATLASMLAGHCPPPSARDGIRRFLRCKAAQTKAPNR